VRPRLWTSATNGHFVYPLGDKWAWRIMVDDVDWGTLLILPPERSLSILPVQPSSCKMERIWAKEMIDVAYEIFLSYSKTSLTCRKILRHGAFCFTSPPKKVLLRIFIAFKTPSHRPGLNQRTFGPMASLLTVTPPRRLRFYTVWGTEKASLNKLQINKYT
jgi:hypothetical protein